MKSSATRWKLPQEQLDYWAAVTASEVAWAVMGLRWSSKHMHRVVMGDRLQPIHRVRPLVCLRLRADTYQSPLRSISVLHKESKGMRTHRPRAVFFEERASGHDHHPSAKLTTPGGLKYFVMFPPCQIGRELRYEAMPLASAT